MSKGHSVRYAAVAGLAVALATSAQAIPIIAVDVDPTLAGIQSERTVTLGDTFGLLVTIANDPSEPVSLFDTIVFDLLQSPLFNSAVTAPLGAPTAGALAGAAPLGALDVFGGLVGTGDALTFGGTSGAAIGMTSLGLPFMLPDVGELDVAMFMFTAVGLGTSVFDLTADPANFDSLLAYTFFDDELGPISMPVPSRTLFGTINVVAPVSVPEPSTFLLFSGALAGMVLLKRRRKAAAA